MTTLIRQQFEKERNLFEQDRDKEDGVGVMKKIIELINELGSNFSSLNGGELSEIQMKLSGYKFYLADYIADLQRESESLKLEIKEQKAKMWDEVTEEIKAKEGKVKNKDQIENVITINTREIANKQILFETMFYKYKLKLGAIDDILTAVVQRIAELKRQVEQSKSI